MTAIKKTVVLVDWDTARRVRPAGVLKAIRFHDAVISALQNGIARYLRSAFDNSTYHRVGWRIYHGWYSGRTKTEDRREFEEYLSTARDRTIQTVSFSTDFKFSDSLRCGSHRTPLYDTLRLDDEKSERQKMVDTALVCDLLHMVRSKDADTYIIVANDDDFVPALFTAEAWRAKAILLHTRELMNPYLQMKGLEQRLDLR